jgi:hypothetical protein
MAAAAAAGCGAPRGALPSGTVTAVAHNPEAQTAVDASLRDAVGRLGVAQAQLQVESVEQREWRDSSLGCPQPGFFYAQVITPGYLIVIVGAGKRLEYHTDTRGRSVMCREL